MCQKRSIFLSAGVCCVVLLLLFVLGNCAGRKVSTISVVNATDYEQLQLHVKYSEGTKAIRIWKSEDSTYYFFLPANVKNENVVFGNLPKGDSVTLGEHSFCADDSIMEAIELNRPYEMQMCVGGNKRDVEKVVFLKSENLPAIYIDTESGILDNIHNDKAVKEGASLTIVDVQGNYALNESIEYIKGRGNSTFYGVDKKTYQIKLFNNKPLLGMNAAKKWILLSNSLDDSLIRNKLVFDFADEYTGVPSVEGVYADVYINSEYVGNYFLCEKNEIAQERLDITDLEERNEAVNTEEALQKGEQYISEDGKIKAVKGLKNPQDITGGYLLEKIPDAGYLEEWRSGFVTNSGVVYGLVSPESATVEQVEYICGLLNEFEEAIAWPDGINPETGKHYSEYMDMDSWTSKYLMEEAFSDPDAPAASMFLYKDSDNVSPLIYSGPMWDYDRAIGGYGTDMYYLDEPLQMGYRGVYAKQLLQHQSVLDMVKEKYRSCFLPYMEGEMQGAVHKLEKELEASAGMNRVRWPKTAGYYSQWSANTDYVIDFLEKRADYLSAAWLNEELYHTVTFLDYNGNVHEQYRVKHGEQVPEAVPAASCYVAIFAGWKNAATNTGFDARLPVLEDATYESQWIEMSVLVKNGLGAAELEALDVDIETLESVVETLKKLREGDS